MQIVGDKCFVLTLLNSSRLNNKMDEKHHTSEIWYAYIQGSANMFWYGIAKSSWQKALWAMIGCY